jgi:hypothetical protein
MEVETLFNNGSVIEDGIVYQNHCIWISILNFITLNNIDENMTVTKLRNIAKYTRPIDYEFNINGDAELDIITNFIKMLDEFDLTLHIFQISGYNGKCIVGFTRIGTGSQIVNILNYGNFHFELILKPTTDVLNRIAYFIETAQSENYVVFGLLSRLSQSQLDDCNVDMLKISKIDRKHLEIINEDELFKDLTNAILKKNELEDNIRENIKSISELQQIKININTLEEFETYKFILENNYNLTNEEKTNLRRKINEIESVKEFLINIIGSRNVSSINTSIEKYETQQKTFERAIVKLNEDIDKLNAILRKNKINKYKILYNS